MQAKTQKIALLNSQIVDTPDTAPTHDLIMDMMEALQTQNDPTNHTIFFDRNMPGNYPAVRII